MNHIYIYALIYLKELTNFPTKTKKEGSLHSSRATSTIQGMDLVQK